MRRGESPALRIGTRNILESINEARYSQSMIGFSHLRLCNVLKFSSLALLLVLLLSTVCLSQTITVRLINQRNGQPLHWAKQTVYLPFPLDPAGQESSLARRIAVESDANGEARFELPKPAPEWLQVSLVLSDDKYIEDCGCQPDGSRTADVLDKGIVVWKGTSVSSLDNVKAQPGEILLLLRPVTFARWLLIRLLGWAERS